MTLSSSNQRYADILSEPLFTPSNQQTTLMSLTGGQRVWIQFQWVFYLPESQQDRRDPFSEQNPQPA